MWLYEGYQLIEGCVLLLGLLFHFFEICEAKIEAKQTFRVYVPVDRFRRHFMSKIIVQHTEIAVISFKDDWLRNRNTLEFIGIWEHLNNPDFNYGEFATIKNKSGLNNFKTSAKELIERANVVCLIAKTGRYGGTYAHKDIAFEFVNWQRLIIISTQMQLNKILYHQNSHRNRNLLFMPTRLICSM